MRSDHFLLSAIHLLLTLFLGILGVFIAILPAAPRLCQVVGEILTGDKMALYAYVTGGSLILFAIALMIGFHQLFKKRYYKVLMKGSQVLVDESIIKEYVRNYWVDLFHKKDALVEVVVGHKQNIEVIAEIPVSEENGLLERIENELGVLLARKLGYEKEFTLTIVSP